MKRRGGEGIYVPVLYFVYYRFVAGYVGNENENDGWMDLVLCVCVKFSQLGIESGIADLI